MNFEKNPTFYLALLSALFVSYKKKLDIMYEKGNETMRPIWGCPPWWLVSLS